MRKILICFVIPLMLASCGCTSADWYPVANENRPFLRWWWLGSAVDEEGLTFNLEEFAAKGFGGVEITPLYGVQGNEMNDRDWLSPEWMAALEYTGQECSRLGLQMDMSNCTGWPFGGTWITPENAAKTFSFNSDTTAVIVTGTGQKVKRAGPGGEGLVMDHYSRQALDAYVKAFDDAFAASGCPWPNTLFNDSFEVYGAGWTEELPEAFFRQHGYRIEDHLKAFALNDGSRESTAVIGDYRSTLSKLYIENFVKPWNEWVRSHGVRTRHQAHGAPANLIDVYAEADIPECEAFGQSPFDINGLHRSGDTRLNDSDPAVFKFASSAAHITGKPYTSCETLTWLTEHFHTTLALCKPEIDLAFASGVNHVYLHGAPYSPQGIGFPGWKFYATVNLSPTNPSIWEVCRPLAEYIARCQAFLTAGSPDADFLMYFPEEDIWHHHFSTQFMQLDIHKMNLTMPQFKSDVLKVLSKGYDVDYISDTYLAAVTVDSKGNLRTEAGTLYKGLVLPTETEYMPDVTREKIEALRDQGACILSCEAVHESGAVPENAMQIEGIYMIRRTNEAGGKNYFIANLGHDDIDRWVDLACDAASVEFFDAMTVERGMAEIRRGQSCGRTSVHLELPSGASVLVKCFPRPVKGVEPWKYLPKSPAEEIDLSANTWTLEFERSFPAMPQSVYVLDGLMPWTELDGGAVNEAVGVYSTSFNLDCSGEDIVLDLGDVRENAEVIVNGEYAGAAICAPFRINIGKYVHPGENTVSIRVRNLPANRIAQMDRDGVVWRIFKDVNIAAVNSRQVVTYEQLESYGWWDVVPSGLNGKVRILVY